MTEQWTAPAWVVLSGVAVVAVLALLVVLCLLQVRRVARRAEARATALSAATTELATELAGLRTDLDRTARSSRTGTHDDSALGGDPASYVITRLGEEPEAAAVEPVATLAPGAFADVVLREGALRSASLLHGVRRALAPETRGRIRAEMRREVKRQRKARRQETRTALREWQARQRAEEPAA